MARIFSGIQPSGELHIGNYLGAVKNWVRLQHEHPGATFCVVDYHAITGRYDPQVLRARRWGMAASLLAAGIDPARVTLFMQSDVPEHTELSWIFTTFTPLGELERQVQFKDKAAREESIPAGLLMYPVLQAADILLYRADAVPVGEDQVQHLELARDTARRFNAKFAVAYFPEPQPMLSPTRRILGLDGQAKMSKSLGNTVGLLEADDAIWGKLRPAVTDPQRVRKSDPGRPEVCNVYQLHRAFSAPAVVAEVEANCRSAGWGCMDCKKALHGAMVAELTPIRARAAELQAAPGRVLEVLEDGAARARAVARQTMREVREIVGLDPLTVSAAALPAEGAPPAAG
ncbi:MAG: tryptophan--tRNA ligase [Gemmatimonadetes bacterium]|nr:tryptophan--tRNA ligase [Gemmatimonadota bacterium]